MAQGAVVMPRVVSCMQPGAELIWAYAHGYIGDPWFSATLRHDPGKPYAQSMFGWIGEAGDSLMTVGHPLIGEEEDYYWSLLEQLEGNVVLTGLSYGSLVLGDFYRWYRQLAAKYQKLSNIGLVLLSPTTARELRQPLRTLVAAGKHIPVEWGPAVMQTAGPLLIKSRDKQLLAFRLEKAGYPQPVIRAILASWGQSAKNSGWLFNSLRGLSASQGLGPRLEDDNILIGHLPPRLDEVIDVPAAWLAAEASYPNAGQFTIGYHGGQATHHGVPELDGPVYAQALFERCRPVFAKRFGLLAV